MTLLAMAAVSALAQPAWAQPAGRIPGPLGHKAPATAKATADCYIPPGPGHRGDPQGL
ncbi:hypothetical protein [Streptomyces orinoci]|uniref:Uncharacterized protein n=1 Tax=Streptomyces orinoci TaxID=67339 RepID=A0ABV3K0D2_STRON|nr:hypothetical protein [Streptomyces orinoci]